MLKHSYTKRHNISTNTVPGTATDYYGVTVWMQADTDGVQCWLLKYKISSNITIGTWFSERVKKILVKFQQNKELSSLNLHDSYIPGKSKKYVVFTCNTGTGSRLR